MFGAASLPRSEGRSCRASNYVGVYTTVEVILTIRLASRPKFHC
jgi:hypothetical protein